MTQPFTSHMDFSEVLQGPGFYIRAPWCQMTETSCSKPKQKKDFFLRWGVRGGGQEWPIKSKCRNETWALKRPGTRHLNMSEPSVCLVPSLLEASWFISSAFSALHFVWLPSLHGTDAATCTNWLTVSQRPTCKLPGERIQTLSLFQEFAPDSIDSCRGERWYQHGCWEPLLVRCREGASERNGPEKMPSRCLPCHLSQLLLSAVRAGPSSLFTSQLSYHLPGDRIPDHTSWNNGHPLPTPSHSFSVVNWIVSSKSMCWSSNTLYLRMWLYLETRSLKRVS